MLEFLDFAVPDRLFISEYAEFFLVRDFSFYYLAADDHVVLFRAEHAFDLHAAQGSFHYFGGHHGQKRAGHVLDKLVDDVILVNRDLFLLAELGRRRREPRVKADDVALRVVGELHVRFADFPDAGADDVQFDFASDRDFVEGFVDGFQTALHIGPDDEAEFFLVRVGLDLRAGLEAFGPFLFLHERGEIFCFFQ